MSHKKKKKEDDEKMAVKLYQHVYSLSKLKYDSELRREDSLITQSSQMQTAFSFMTAALFMVLPIIIDKRSRLISLNYIAVATSSTVGLLLLSLWFASEAQSRKKKVALENISEIEKHISDNWEMSIRESQQLKQRVDALKVVQEDLSKLNDKRATYIRISMGCYKGSILLIVFWFIVALIKIL